MTRTLDEMIISPVVTEGDGIVVLCSGGLASLTILTSLMLIMSPVCSGKIVAMHLDYGQPSSDAERASLARIGQYVDIEHVNIPLYEIGLRRIEQTDAELRRLNTQIADVRNPVLFSVAQVMAAGRGFKHIAFGMTAWDMNYDLSHYVIVAMNHMLANNGITLHVPLSRLNRRDVYECAALLDPDILFHAVVCVNQQPGPERTFCGTCPPCIDFLSFTTVFHE